MNILDQVLGSNPHSCGHNDGTYFFVRKDCEVATLPHSEITEAEDFQYAVEHLNCDSSATSFKLCMQCRKNLPSHKSRETNAGMTQKNSRLVPRLAQNITSVLNDALGALALLQELQEHYQDWQDNLPESLESSALAEKLETVCELDIEDTYDDLNELEKNVVLGILTPKDLPVSHPPIQSGKRRPSKPQTWDKATSHLIEDLDWLLDILERQDQVTSQYEYELDELVSLLEDLKDKAEEWSMIDLPRGFGRD